MASKPVKSSKTKQQFASTQNELIVCDLEYSRVVEEMSDLELDELEQFEETVEKVKKMTWEQVYKTSSKTQKRGLNWEPIKGQATQSGKAIASIRISRKFRARVCRDRKIMRFISLHPVHDSAYDENGGENI